MRNFDDLSEREILALAISNEEEDARIFADFADGPHDDFPASAKVFDEMAAEENGHRRRLIDLFVSKFGDHIPLVRRDHIRGYIPPKPVWHQRPLGIETGATHARDMERAAARFDRQALDAYIRRFDLEAPRRSRRGGGETRSDRRGPRGANTDGLRPQQRGRKSAPAFHFAGHPTGAGRPDGRVGLDARAGIRCGGRDPQFMECVRRRARGFGRRRHLHGLCRGARGRRQAFRPRFAASAGRRLRIDDHGGRIGDILPFLIPEFYTAMVVAFVVVVFELLAISYVQWRYMDTPPVLGRREGDVGRRAGAGGGNSDRLELTGGRRIRGSGVRGSWYSSSGDGRGGTMQGIRST